MPKQKLENTFRSWTKAEYFAHTKNAMAEMTLRSELSQLSRSNFNQHLKTKGVFQDVHDTVTPLKQTTGHYKHQPKVPKFQPKKVTFTEDEEEFQEEDGDEENSETGQENLQSNVDNHQQLTPENLTQRTKTQKRSTQMNLKLSKGHDKPLGSKSLRTTQSLPTPSFSRLLKNRCQSAPSSFKLKHPPTDIPHVTEEPNSAENSKLSLGQITKINAFYLAKRKTRQSAEHQIHTTKTSTKTPGKASESVQKIPNHNLESQNNHLKRESLWKKVTLDRVLALQGSNRMVGELGKGCSDSAGSGVQSSQGHTNQQDAVARSRQIQRMPRLYEVFLMAKARFQDKAAEAKQSRSRSLVSQSDVSEKSMGTGTEVSSFLNSSFVTSDSEDETVNVSFSDPLETYLWKQKQPEEEDREKKGKKKKRKKQKEHVQDETFTDSKVDSEENIETDKGVSPLPSEEEKDANSKGGISSITVYLTDTSEDVPTDYITAPTYSLSLNTSARPTEPDTPAPRPQTTPVHVKALAFARTDTTQYQRTPGHWNYARESVPIAQYIRAVEAGLAIDGFIEPVSDLRVPLSRGAIRRQRQDMVRSQDKTKTVNTDLEKVRMQEIQNRINDFLLTLPKPKRSVFY